MENSNPESLANPMPTIEIIYAGGTIASFATPGGYREGGHDVDLVTELAKHLPEFNPDFEVGHKQTAYTGLSENMTAEYWSAIDCAVTDALTRNPRGIMLTHGTDSMEQTARHLMAQFGDALLQAKSRIILTGANEDMLHPQTDAWTNLQFALECGVKNDTEPGVYVAFHGRLVPAEYVIKLPLVGQDEATFVDSRSDEYKQALQTQYDHAQALNNRLLEHYGQRPDARAVVRYDTNIIRENHLEFLQFIDSHEIKSVLLTLYHSGTANTETPGQSVSELVQHLVSKGVVCFGVTENGEPVDLHSYETSVKLRQAGIVPLYDMPGSVALTKLQLLHTDLTAVQKIGEMLASKVGEINESLVNPEDIESLKALYNK